MKKLLAIVAALVGLSMTSQTFAIEGPAACVQTYLTAIGYPVGAIDGRLGKRTTAYGKAFAGVYPDLKLPELTRDSATAWCEILSGPAGSAVLESRPLPTANAPTDTIGKNGGLNFGSRLVTENYINVDDLKHGFETSKRPGRVTVDVDPSHVHLGDSSIRMHLLPGDCDWSTNRDSGEWNDCEHFNSRVDTTASPTGAGEWYYGLSLMIGSNFLDLKPYPKRYLAADINLFQWFQYDSGACFNLMYNATSKGLVVDVRCINGVYEDKDLRVDMPDSRPDVWHEFVVHANWSTGGDGYFRVIQNGMMVMNYQGPTIVEAGRPLINDHPQIYAYGGDLAEEASWMQYRTPVTAWFDGMIRSRKLAEVRKLYVFPDAALTDFASAQPIKDYNSDLPLPVVVPNPN